MRQNSDTGHYAPIHRSFSWYRQIGATGRNKAKSCSCIIFGRNPPWHLVTKGVSTTALRHPIATRIPLWVWIWLKGSIHPLCPSQYSWKAILTISKVLGVGYGIGGVEVALRNETGAPRVILKGDKFDQPASNDNFTGQNIRGVSLFSEKLNEGEISSLRHQFCLGVPVLRQLRGGIRYFLTYRSSLIPYPVRKFP